MMRVRLWAVALATATVSAAAVPVIANAGADDEAELTSIAIAGSATEGATLTAEVAAKRRGKADLVLSWLRCDPVLPLCTSIPGAGAITYVPSAADVGSRIAVYVELRGKGDDDDAELHDSGTSAPTGVVTGAAAPPGSPPPQPGPAPAPQPTVTPQPAQPAGPTPEPDEGDPFAQGGASAGTPTVPLAPTAAGSLRYLQPFPVVRIRGRVAARGSHVTLLRVTGHRSARVRASCLGAGCPVARLTRRPGRLGSFERYLPAGTRITVRVTRPGRVGKYVRLRIRAGRAPARIDACLLPGSRLAVTCPPA